LETGGADGASVVGVEVVEVLLKGPVVVIVVDEVALGDTAKVFVENRNSDPTSTSASSVSKRANRNFQWRWDCGSGEVCISLNRNSDVAR
jgi:hypothetical protein